MHPGALPTVVAADVPDGATILDVREDDEWTAGHIAGSVHVPLSQLPGRAPTSRRPTRWWWSAGSAPGRPRSTAWLAGQGRDADNLAGGLDAWADAGRPLVTDDGGPGTVA